MTRLVMVIDDSLTVRKILEVALRREGVDVIAYADGFEALDTLGAQPDLTPAVIFIDICMPQMDGFTLLRLLRASPRFDSTLIVMLSRRDGIMDRLKSRLAGATIYMTKPFKVQDVLSVVLPHLPAAPLSSIERTRDTEAIAKVETKRRNSLLSSIVTPNSTPTYQEYRPEYIEHFA
jgi:twitching motility two-component system response regulator PilG